MKMTNVRKVLRAVMVVFVLIVTGWSATAISAETVLKVVPIGNLSGTDPIWTTAMVTRNHGYLVFDTLFALDENFNPKPQMVESYTISSDKLKYTFTLRPGLKWHDGERVLSKDCVASLKRWGARDGMGQMLMTFTKSIDVVNDRTFSLTLKEPVGFVLQALGKLESIVPFMMPERLAKTDPFKQIPEVIGSGPFKFVKTEWVPGSKVVYVKNEDYIPRSEPASLAAGGKVVKVDRVEWHYMSDPAIAIAALNAGEVDLLDYPSPDLLRMLIGNPDVVVEQTDPLGNQSVLRLNWLHPPFNNVKARQAFQWVVDQRDFMTAAYGDQNWIKCPSFYGCGTPYETSAGSEALMNVNKEKATQLLRESGYKGEPIVILDPTDRAHLHALSLVAAQKLREIGAKVDVQAVDWGTLVERRASQKLPAEGGWNIFPTTTLVIGLMEPLSSVFIATNCDKAWYGWPCDEAIEKMRMEWVRSDDPVKKKKIAEEIQKRAHELVVYTPLGQLPGMAAYRKNLKGLIKSPVPFYWNVSKEK